MASDPNAPNISGEQYEHFDILGPAETRTCTTRVRIYVAARRIRKRMAFSSYA